MPVFRVSGNSSPAPRADAMGHSHGGCRRKILRCCRSRCKSRLDTGPQAGFAIFRSCAFNRAWPGGSWSFILIEGFRSAKHGVMSPVAQLMVSWGESEIASVRCRSSGDHISYAVFPAFTDIRPVYTHDCFSFQSFRRDGTTGGGRQSDVFS